VFVPVLRPDDLVLLEIGWSGLELRAAGEGPDGAASLVTDGSNDGALLVRLPPQAIEEDAYFEEATDEQQGEGIQENTVVDELPPPGVRDQSPPDVVGSRLAAASRLAFTVPNDFPPIPFTVEGLLDALTRLPLRVHPSALPRQLLPRVHLGLRDLFDAALSGKLLASRRA
jgi:hypothetical protein